MMTFEKNNPLVTDRRSFISFIKNLKERLDTAKSEDEFLNTSLSDFLEALAAYSEDIQGYYDNTGQQIDADEPRWQTFADLLQGASIYE